MSCANLAIAALDGCQISIKLKGEIYLNAITQTVVCFSPPDLDSVTRICREKSAWSENWKEVITHHTPGRTRRVDRQHKEGGGRCTRLELPGGWWVWSHAETKSTTEIRRWGDTKRHDGLNMYANQELTAEYIMNLRVLPSSTALEKFLRMAFSRTPGNEYSVNSANEFFPDRNTILLTLSSLSSFYH